MQSLIRKTRYMAIQAGVPQGGIFAHTNESVLFNATSRGSCTYLNQVHGS